MNIESDSDFGFFEDESPAIMGTRSGGSDMFKNLEMRSNEHGEIDFVLNEDSKTSSGQEPSKANATSTAPANVTEPGNQSTDGSVIDWEKRYKDEQRFINQLSESNKDLVQHNQELQNRLSELAGKVDALTQLSGDDYEDDSTPNEAEIKDFIASAVEDSLVTRLEQKLNLPEGSLPEILQQAGRAHAANAELRTVAQKYPDFLEYRNEVGQVLDKIPNLSFEQAYLLVKSHKQQPASANPSNASQTGTQPAPERSEQAQPSTRQSTQLRGHQGALSRGELSDSGEIKSVRDAAYAALDELYNR